MEVISIHNAAMPRNLDTTLLRSFAVVADHASMTAAADQIAQSMSSGKKHFSSRSGATAGLAGAF